MIQTSLKRINQSVLQMNKHKKFAKHISYYRCIKSLNRVGCCKFCRESHVRAADKENCGLCNGCIENWLSNGKGRGKAHGGILLQLFPQVEIRSIASGQLEGNAS